MSGDWAQIPIGAGVAILLLREVFRFLKEREDSGTPSLLQNGQSGKKPVEFWEGRMREIVYSEIERHVIPVQREIHDKLVGIDQMVREIRWRNRVERRDD